jgi:hypothetical protein
MSRFKESLATPEHRLGLRIMDRDRERHTGQAYSVDTPSVFGARFLNKTFMNTYKHIAAQEPIEL